MLECCLFIYVLFGDIQLIDVIILQFFLKFFIFFVDFVKDVFLLGGLFEIGFEGVVDEGLVGGKVKIFFNVFIRIVLVFERFEVCSFIFFILQYFMDDGFNFFRYLVSFVLFVFLFLKIGGEYMRDFGIVL